MLINRTQPLGDLVGQLSGDVLIGADGLHSTVRTLIDPATAAPRYVGQRIF